jgi:competence protein ComEC
VGAWTLPIAAAAFAGGLLAWPAMPEWVQPSMPLGLGGVALLGAWIFAGRPAGGAHPLVRAGLLPAEPAPVAAIAPTRTELRAPLGAVVFVIAGILTLGVGWGGFRDRGLDTAFLASLAPERVTLEGTLKTDPAASTFGWSAEVYVRTVEWRGGAASLRSAIWASGDGPTPHARRGDRVELEGVLRVPDDPGFAQALRHKGIPAQLQLSAFRRSGGSANLFVRATQATRGAVGRSITRVFPSREAGLLLGLVLGDDSALEPGMERDFRAAGLSHLLVVSGENVAMILAPVLAAVALLRLSRWPRFVVGFGTVAFFTVLTGAEPSVLRAGVMAGLALIGVLMGRPRAIASILSAAVLSLLVLDPWLIWSVGFQLSVAATAGMVSVATQLAAWCQRVAPKPLAIAAGASMAAQLGVTPILLTHFGEVPLVTLPANLLAFPLVAPALLLGVLASGLGLVWLPIGMAIGALARVPMRGLEVIADRLGKAPVGYLTADGGPFVLIVGTVVVIALIVWIRTRWRPPRAVTAVAVAALPLVVWGSGLTSGPPSGLMVRFFDVGQVDAALLTTPEGASVLFDGGPDEEQVARELAAVGV